MRRLPIGLIALPVIGFLLLPIVTNITASELPNSWKPYLWLAWPIALILAVPTIYVEVRERHQRQGAAAPEGSRDELPHKAQHDLAVAVRDQWTEEAGVRSLRAPEPIRVSWSSTDRSVAPELAKVLNLSASDGHPKRTRGDISDVTRMLRKIRSRQLVILGGAAAGKTVMTLLLTLDLLSDQPYPQADEPVPVLLSISAWNPHAENMHAWVARRIVEEYPALANSSVYGAEAAMRLVSGKLVIPVLDGLDEMAKNSRPAAISAIAQAVTDQYPLVLTSRADEYEEAIKKGGRMLTHAAVLEIQPGTIRQAMNFLCEAIPAPQRWQPVASYLDSNPDSPLARVLSSPLMVDLARTVYGTAYKNPADLLQLPDQPAIEHHLIGAFLTAAYDQRSVRRETRSPARYDAERAGAWLRFLADHTGSSGQPDIAWWQVEHAMPKATRGMLAGFTVGLMTGLVEIFPFGLVYGLAYALAFGFGTGAAFACGSTRPPSRITVRFRGNGQSLLVRGIGGLLVGCGVTAVDGSLVGLWYGGLLAIALMIHRWLGAPPDVTIGATPADSLKEDRSAALVFGGILCGAILFGILPFFRVAFSGNISGSSLSFESMSMILRIPIGMAVGAGYGVILGGFIYGKAGAVSYGAAGAITLGLFYRTDRFPIPNWADALIVAPVICMIIGCLVILSRAWGAYTLARLYLALRGRLPWHLMRFLDDARERGILRQSGKVYQFRHERLREHFTGAEEHESRFSAPVITDTAN